MIKLARKKKKSKNRPVFGECPPRGTKQFYAYVEAFVDPYYLDEEEQKEYFELLAKKAAIENQNIYY